MKMRSRTTTEGPVPKEHLKLVLEASQNDELKMARSRKTAPAPTATPPPIPTRNPTVVPIENQSGQLSLSSSASNSTPTAPNSKLDEMESLCGSLLTLARNSYTTRNSKIVTAAGYVRVQQKIAAFFQRTDGFDFVADGTYGMCLGMKSLMLLIEMNVRPGSGYRYEHISWPIAQLTAEEENVLTKAVYEGVDELIWGKEKLEVGEKKRGMRNSGHGTKNRIRGKK